MRNVLTYHAKRTAYQLLSRVGGEGDGYPCHGTVVVEGGRIAETGKQNQGPSSMNQKAYLANIHFGVLGAQPIDKSDPETGGELLTVAGLGSPAFFLDILQTDGNDPAIHPSLARNISGFFAEDNENNVMPSLGTVEDHNFDHCWSVIGVILPGDTNTSTPRPLFDMTGGDNHGLPGTLSFVGGCVLMDLRGKPPLTLNLRHPKLGLRTDLTLDKANFIVGDVYLTNGPDERSFADPNLDGQGYRDLIADLESNPMTDGSGTVTIVNTAGPPPPPPPDAVVYGFRDRIIPADPAVTIDKGFSEAFSIDPNGNQLLSVTCTDSDQDAQSQLGFSTSAHRKRYLDYAQGQTLDFQWFGQDPGAVLDAGFRSAYQAWQKNVVFGAENTAATTSDIRG